MNNKIFIIIAIIIVLTLIPIKMVVDQETIKRAFRRIATDSGTARAQDLERLYRLETAHFKSKQFTETGAPGMEAFSGKFPYGWTSLLPFWTKYPQHAPNGFYSIFENVGLGDREQKQKNFLKFPSFESALLSLNAYVDRYPIERWYSTRPEEQQKYRYTLNSIIPRFT